MTPRGRLTLAASAVGTLVVLVLLFQLASKPSYSTLLTGVDPSDTGKITAILDEKAIGYELRAGGTAVAVEQEKMSEARVALAEEGLPGQGQPGFEILDDQGLSTSEFKQKVDYQRALEGEIARTISEIDGVAGARVQLVLPDDQLFAEEASPARAAVVLDGSADTLDPGAIRGMAGLVTSSVKGLKTADVTITDGTGSILWPSSSSTTDGGVGATAKLAAETRYESMLNGRLDSLLTQIVGPGMAHAESQVDLNVDQISTSKLDYNEKGSPLTESRDQEQLEGGAAGAGGVAGTAGNVPNYTAGGGGGAGGGAAGSNYRNSSESTEFLHDKTVTHTQVAPGAVEGLDVSVIIDEGALTPPQLTAVKKAISGASGIDLTRGDTLTVTSLPFAKPAPVKPEAKGPIPPAAVGAAKPVGLGLAVLAFMFFMMRYLRRREREALADPTWLREINAPISLSQLETAEPTRVLEPVGHPERRELEQIAEKDPDRIAHQVRAWMANE